MATDKKKKTEAKERVNIHRFHISGYIVVDPKDTKTIVSAADTVNKTIDGLKASGATIENENSYFTSTTVDKSDGEDDDGDED